MYKVDGFWFMVFNTTCKYISVTSLWSVLLVEGTWFFHLWIILCKPILYLKCSRYLHVMLGWFSTDPSCILYSQDVYMSCLDVYMCMLGWYFVDPSYILKGKYVYTSCLDGLVQTHLICLLKWSRCLHPMLGWFSSDPS